MERSFQRANNKDSVPPPCRFDSEHFVVIFGDPDGHGKASTEFKNVYDTVEPVEPFDELRSHSPPVICTTPAPAKSVAPHPSRSARESSLHCWYSSAVNASSHRWALAHPPGLQVQCTTLCTVERGIALIIFPSRTLSQRRRFKSTARMKRPGPIPPPNTEPTQGC